MLGLHRLALLAAFAVPAAAAFADSAPASGMHIYQQRLADGRVVLTDRPVDGAQIQRTWQIAREDPDAARERSEQVRLEAQAVSERVQRGIEQQQARADNADLERLRVSLAEARRDAAIARESALDTPVMFLPRALARSTRPHMRPPHPGVHPGPGHPRSMWPQPGSF